MIDEPTQTTPDEASHATRRRRVPLWILGVAGVALGALIGLGAAALLARDDGVDPDRIVLQNADDARADHQAARGAFLDAWRRYRTATYTAQIAFERVAKNGQKLESSSTYTQRPPMRVVRQADSMLLTAGADSLSCNTVGGRMVCAPAPATDYDADVSKELEIWKTALDGDRPYYRVSQPATDCFQLDLAVVLTDPPYGDVARFCFDAATGALAFRQIVRPSATDTEEATSISTSIPADAFAVPATTR